MNKKEIGEIGERIAIGELAKFGINVALPLSDNLPFDLIVYYNDKFFKCLVKTSHKISENNSLVFNITSNNWYTHSTHYYTKDEVDVWILCDGNQIYLMRFDENNNKNIISLRLDPPKNNQKEKIKYLKDYLISSDRIKEVFK